MTPIERGPKRFRWEWLYIAGLLYCFLLSIKLLGGGFQTMGGGFTSLLQHTVSNPLVGLAIGIFVTSVVQSSSCTTSIVVGLVAAGQLEVVMAVPIVMGANIGTTITNTLVSIAHVPHRPEFRRAVTTATLHDFFNLCCVVILFPLEWMTRHLFGQGFLQFSAQNLTGLLVGVKAGKMPSPLGFFVKPLVRGVENVVGSIVAALTKSGEAPHVVLGAVLIVLALSVLFLSLTYLVKCLRKVMSGRMENILDKYLFASAGRALLVGTVLTTLVQSSSVTTSLMVPLGAAGLLTVEQVFPYMMGANIGTTFTAILASLATDSPAALTVALVHLLFNATGVALMFTIRPLRRVPLRLSRLMGFAVMRNRSVVLVYGVCVFFILPGLVILVGALTGR